ncbi:hypothetical protein [Mesorhizobium sp.]|uniref:hypothetical protein n=1 Tax=Mesorhizobium sp. TaxID=1871066 RepID=UPI002580AA67|nr:hypothetical protein [Mesorhizobium sp.]
MPATGLQLVQLPAEIIAADHVEHGVDATLALADFGEVLGAVSIATSAPSALAAASAPSALAAAALAAPRPVVITLAQAGWPS